MRNKKDIASHEAKRPAVPDLKAAWSFNFWCEKFAEYALKAKDRDSSDKVTVEFNGDWAEPQWTIAVVSERPQYNTDLDVESVWTRRVWTRVRFDSTVKDVVDQIDLLILDNRNAFRHIAKKSETT